MERNSHQMERNSHSAPLLLFMYLLAITSGDPRSRKVEIKCSSQLEHNQTAYVPNFLAAMDNIAKRIQMDGFGISNVGSIPDENYSLAQCYGDLSQFDCALCYAEARTDLPQCFPSNGGRIYLDGCFMRSDNYSFYKEYTGPDDKVICGNKTRNSAQFQQLARRAIEEATGKAPYSEGYAKYDASSNGNSVFVLANCWKTLDSSSCQACLRNASTSLMRCLPMSEGRALFTGCFIRYSDTNFLNVYQNGKHGKGGIIAMVIAIVSALVVLGLGVTVGLFIWKRRRIQKKRKGSREGPKVEAALYHSSLNFKYSTLEKATGSFSSSNKIGQGGYGTVYKGILPDGREIAVKRLFFNNRNRATDFLNEANIISSLEHKNLVRLLGCSCLGPESLLVYEFLSNLSLDRFIFDREKGKTLDWRKRFNIITCTAEGLAYLHENSVIRIIHRDIKASNILLDQKFQAKIADFGLARSFQEDKSHISTAIAGTLGYMAPEYLAHGQLTEKADVYSFGVVVLEVVTGKSNNRTRVYDYSESVSDDSEGLLTQVWKSFQLSRLKDLIDPNLSLQNQENCILRVMHVGLLCTQENPSLRPTMSQALHMLLEWDEQLPQPTRPPFTVENTMMELNVADEHQQNAINSVASNATYSRSSIYPR